MTEMEYLQITAPSSILVMYPFTLQYSTLSLFLDVAYFEESLMKYTSQHNKAVAINETRHIGMMVVDTKKLKEVLIPCPLKCLQVCFLSKIVLGHYGVHFHL